MNNTNTITNPINCGFAGYTYNVTSFCYTSFSNTTLSGTHTFIFYYTNYYMLLGQQGNLQSFTNYTCTTCNVTNTLYTITNSTTTCQAVYSIFLSLILIFVYR